MADIFIDKMSPGSPLTSIVGSRIVISVAKPLTENFDKFQLESKMGNIKLPPAEALGLPSGTSVGIKVLLL